MDAELFEPVGEGVVMMLEGLHPLHQLTDPPPYPVSVEVGVLGSSAAAAGWERMLDMGVMPGMARFVADGPVTGPQIQAGVDQMFHAFPAARGDGYDRYPELDGEFLHVDADSLVPGLIAHVQGNHHGLILGDELQGHGKVPFQVGRIYDIDDPFGIVDEINRYPGRFV